MSVGVIVPDYAAPAAVLVPHFYSDLTGLLEEIADRAARSTGVILLTREPALTEAFLATRRDPDRFRVVTAPFDSPWLRDRAPVAVRGRSGVRWFVPRYRYQGRPRDNRLFWRILARGHPVLPVPYLPGGNLVAGARGLALVSREVLRDNHLDEQELHRHGAAFGVRRWVVFTPFRREQTGHADIHVRVLRPHLYAVAWNHSSREDRERALRLESAIRKADPQASCLRIPIRSRGDRYASLVNWLQLGRRLLIPRFPLTPAEDLRETERLLSSQGFRPEFLWCPTLEWHGAIHCLTASLYI